MARGNSFRVLDGPFSFPAVFVIGAGAIVLCRLMTPTNPRLGALLAAAAAVVVVVLLGWYSCRTRGRGEEISRSGDDLYYLGLLFTLVSLIHALIALFILNDGTTDLTERTYHLIGSFGIALFSTVAGILGRVILHSMQDTQQGAQVDGVTDYQRVGGSGRGPRTSGGRFFQGFWKSESLGGTDGPSRPPRPDDRVPGGTGGSRRPPGPDILPSESGPVVFVNPQGDLDLLARRLRAEISGAADAFSYFNRVTMLQAQDTKRHAEGIANELGVKLRADAQTAITQTEEAYLKLADLAKTTTDAVERRINETADTLATLVEQFGSAASSFVKVSVSAEQTQHAVEALGQSVTSVTGSLNDKVGSVVTAYETVVLNLQKHQQVMDRDFDKTRTLTARTEALYGKLADRVEIATDTVEGQIGAAAGAFAKLVEQLGPASRSFSELPVKVEQTRRGVEALTDTLKTTMGALDNIAGNILRESETLALGTRDHQAVMDQNSERAKVIGLRMDAEVSEWSERAERIRATFVVLDEAADAVDMLGKQLRTLNRFLTAMTTNLEENPLSTDSPDVTATTSMLPRNRESHRDRSS